jgi:hypothetical protein
MGLAGCLTATGGADAMDGLRFAEQQRRCDARRQWFAITRHSFALQYHIFSVQEREKPGPVAGGSSFLCPCAT